MAKRIRGKEDQGNDERLTKSPAGNSSRRRPKILLWSTVVQWSPQTEGSSDSPHGRRGD